MEAPEGDSFRYTLRQPQRDDQPKAKAGARLDFPWQLDNRGKKSIAVDLSSAEGAALIHQLCARVDIFLTNLTPPRLRRYDLEPATLRQLNRRLIVASVSGWGLEGPMRDENSFDVTAFFARGGVMSLLGEPGENAVKPPLGMGDHTTGLAALGSILAALLLRARTGEGAVCESSLMRSATWTLGAELACTLVDGKQPKKRSRFDSPNVLSNTYRLGDGKWIILVMPFPRYWPKFCDALGTADAAAWKGAGHAYGTPSGRSKNREALTKLLDGVLAAQPLAHWGPRFDAHGVIWAPVAELSELVQDEQAQASGAFATLTHPVAGEFRTVNTPFGLFAGAGDAADAARGESRDSAVFVGPRGCGPEPGEHTRSVMAGLLGMGEGELDRLEQTGVLGFVPKAGSPVAKWAETGGKRD